MFQKLVFMACFCLLLANPLFAQDSSLIGWWKLDEGAGDVAADSSGNGNDGDITGGPEWVTGWVGGALKFDGIDDAVNMGNDAIFDITDELTLAVWVNANDIGSGQDNPWLGKGDTSYMIKNFRTGYDLEFFIYDGGWFSAHYTVDDTMNGEWHHVAGTYDGSVLQIYLDGVPGEDAFLDHIGTIDVTDYDVTIGTNSQAGGRFSDATLDDCRIYNRALSEDEIFAMMLGDVRNAWRPRPADGAVEVGLDTTLIWNPGFVDQDAGLQYNEHQLYFGTVFEDVNTATEPTAILTDVNEYAVPLDYDTTYYWRVDEVSDSDPLSPVKGNVWSFTTANFIVVEDFEDYNDFPPNEIFNTWIDGWGDASNGSTAGYPAPDFVVGEHYLEGDIVHGGDWSMPLFYTNGSSGLSEATKTLTSVRDWTVDDVLTLTLFYRGNLSNGAEPMFVALNGNAVVANDDLKAAQAIEWTRWDILLQDFADQGVNLTNVNTISIGLGNKANPTPGGGSGHVFFDDIRLYRSAPVEQEPKPEPIDPGTDNLVALYSFENNVNDSSGNGLNGTISGNPMYADGISGMAMSLDGVNDYINLGNNPMFDITEQITLTAWVNTNDSGDGQHNPYISKGDTAYAIKHASGNTIQFFIYDEDWYSANYSVNDSFNGDWHFVAGTYDGAEVKLYVDGSLAGTVAHEGTIGVQTFNVAIGTNTEAEGRFYWGLIDEARIYNRALTINEITYLVDNR